MSTEIATDLLTIARQYSKKTLFVRFEIKDDFEDKDFDEMNRILKQTHGIGSSFYDFDTMKYLSYWIIEEPNENNRLP